MGEVGCYVMGGVDEASEANDAMCGVGQGRCWTRASVRMRGTG